MSRFSSNSAELCHHQFSFESSYTQTVEFRIADRKILVLIVACKALLTPSHRKNLELITNSACIKLQKCMRLS